LQQGLNYLSTSIAQKSGSLKLLVESNFDRFVAAKGTIEGVYKEMKENSFLDGGKESEWGVGRIRGYLSDAGEKADEVFGPAMRGRGREEGLRIALSAVEKHRNMLEVPGNLSDAIKRKDYESLIEEHQKARGFLDESRELVPTGTTTNVKEEHIHQLVIAESMWLEVAMVIEDFKRETWKRLVECGTEGSLHLELIGILLELGVEDNPVWFWLLSRYDYLKNRITAVFERSRVEVEVLRRKVADAPAPSPESVAHHLRSPSRRTHFDSQKALDTQLITSLWELVYSSLSALLSPSSGLVGEILSFQKTAQSFIDGDNLLPVGMDDQSRRHHRLDPSDIRKLQDGICELVVMVRDCLVAFFMEPPVEDISTMYSPIPPTPLSATAPGQDANFFPVPPALKARAQSDEEESYAFLPPGTNSLSGVHYMGKILVLAGNASVAICEVTGRFGRADIAEKFRAMISGSRERAVVAICAAWLKDAGDCRYLEDWTRAGDNRDVTRMPGLFGAFEREVIGGMQAIVYLDKVGRSDSGVIVWLQTSHTIYSLLIPLHHIASTIRQAPLPRPISVRPLAIQVTPRHG
jgi:exocyst complex component 2